MVTGCVNGFTSLNSTLADYDGLALFVNTKGGKCWHFCFSRAEKQPRISFGTYPEVSLRNARTLRDVAQAQAARGIDTRVSIPAISDGLSTMPNC